MSAIPLETLYETLEAQGVDVFSCPLGSLKAVAEPSGYLGLNPQHLAGAAEERAVLIHEEGHFATGTFYQLDSPFTVRRHQENVACRYGYEKYFPLDAILDAMQDGHTEPWDLAEHFDVPLCYISEMLEYYRTAQNVDFAAALAARKERAEPESAPCP